MFDPQSINNPRWDTFQSHKVVRAAKITKIYSNTCVGIGVDGYSVVFDPEGKPTPDVGWYVLAYDDGYISFSPATAFEGGYNLLPTPKPAAPAYA